MAFFVLGYDQDLNAPVSVFARDPATNEATSAVDRKQFPKPFMKSRIEIDDRFLGRVVPAIAQNTPGGGIDTNDLLKGFLTINNDLRQQNNQTIAALAAKTKPEMLWREAFSQLGNTPSSRASPTSAPTSIKARRSTSKCTSASISPRCSRRRCTPPIAASSCSPTTSASTATAS